MLNQTTYMTLKGDLYKVTRVAPTCLSVTKLETEADCLSGKPADYTVTLEHGRPVCTCAGHHFRKTCRHLSLVSILTGGSNG